MVAMHNKGVAPLIPDRSSQIKSDILFLSNPYFADRCMDWLSLNMATDALIFASAALWIDLPDIQKRRGGDLWLKLITVNTRRPIGYDDMRFSSRAIDFDWSIDQGGGSRRIDHSPDGSWQENKIKDCFLIFVLKWRRDVSSQFWHSLDKNNDNVEACHGAKDANRSDSSFQPWNDFSTKVFLSSSPWRRRMRCWRWQQVQVIPYSNHEAAAGPKFMILLPPPLPSTSRTRSTTTESMRNIT